MANSKIKWFRNILTLLVLFLLIYIYNDSECEGDDCGLDGPVKAFGKEVKNEVPKKQETMHVMTVSCGRPNYQGIKDIKKPLDQSLTMIKSAALFARQRLHIHIFTEEDMVPLFQGSF